MFFTLVHKLDSWDRLMVLRIFTWPQRDYLNRIMYWASRSGDGPLYPVMALVVGLLAPARALSFLMAELIAFAINLGLYTVLKQTTRRARPCSADERAIRNRIKPPDRFSFPSGHSAAAFLMATLIYTFWPLGGWIAFAGAGLIAFSRVYNGVHYMTDIIAGGLIGIASAQAGLQLVM